MTYENYIKGRLVEFAVQEAYLYGGTACMCAVAQVIANRVSAGWGEWKNVLDTTAKYTGNVHVLTPSFEPRDITFRHMLSLVDDIYLGTADDTNVNVSDDRGTLTALYYADLASPLSDWFRVTVSNHIDKHPRIATVGPLTFFA
jgi:hypothetical protein